MVVSETIHAGVVKRQRLWPSQVMWFEREFLPDDLANRFPHHTIVQSYDVPTIPPNWR